MTEFVNWLCVLLVILAASSSVANQDRGIGEYSGDDDDNDVHFDKRSGGRKPDRLDDYEIDENSGDVAIIQPGLGSERGGPDDIGGGGIIIETSDPIDISGQHKRCPDQNYCLNGGVCYLFLATKTKHCQCQQSFKGDRCEFDDLVIKEVINEPETQRSSFIDIMTHPAAIAAMVAAGLLILGLIITMLVCCCLCIRKKDEGSYALDSALKGPGVEYTKVNNTSQEFYA